MIQYSKEVETAIHGGAPVVALESTIISHGLPRPTNLTVARDVEEIVRSRGAVPATIAIIRGVIHIGLESAELELVANEDGIRKASIRDLPVVTAKIGSAHV